MANCDSATRDAFRCTLGIAQDEARNQLGLRYAASRDNFWPIWATFCGQHGHDPYLPHVPNKLPFLCVFAQRYRSGLLASRGHPVRSKQVQEAVRSVATGFTRLGLIDPRLNCFGQLDVSLTTLYQGYSKQDPPPRRVKPIPLPLLHYVYRSADLADDPLCRATADMAYLGFFYLLRPGEYCLSPDSTPFRICDVQLRIGNIVLNIMTCSFATLMRATCAQLEFTDQKNMISGEVLAHGRSGHYLACPVAALTRRLLHPLYHVYTTPGDARRRR